MPERMKSPATKSPGATRYRKTARKQPGDAEAGSLRGVLDSTLAAIVVAAGTAGSASRSELLAAAVTARADVGVLTVLLRLPEGNYRDIDQVRAALLVPQ